MRCFSTAARSSVRLFRAFRQAASSVPLIVARLYARRPVTGSTPQLAANLRAPRCGCLGVPQPCTRCESRSNSHPTVIFSIADTAYNLVRVGRVGLEPTAKGL
jgi:hypothetical protein